MVQFLSKFFFLGFLPFLLGFSKVPVFFVSLCILIMYLRILLRMRNLSYESCTENQNTHFVFSIFFLNLAVYKIMWENIVERGRPQMTIWRMRITCWIPKVTNTHSKYVVHVAFQWQQWQYKLRCLSCIWCFGFFINSLTFDPFY